MLNSFRIGHYTDDNVGTGVTVLLAPYGAIGGVSVRGAAPATRETDLLRPENTVGTINAVVLSGGSAYGLESCCGVMDYFRKKGLGYYTGAFNVPIVCGASLYDLEYKTFGYPNKEAGERACNSAHDFYDDGGSIGAGAGATVGKLLGMNSAVKSGLGVAVLKIGAIELAAVVAVNAFGNVYEADSDKLLKGATLNGKSINIEQALKHGVEGIKGYNTTIGCIVTNAKLTKAECCRLADTVHDAYARCIRPVHTVVDGDAVFVMTSGEVECSMLAMQTACVKLMCEAIHNAASR